MLGLQIALGPKAKKETSVSIDVNGQTFYLATLHKDKLPQLAVRGMNCSAPRAFRRLARARLLLSRRYGLHRAACASPAASQLT